MEATEYEMLERVIAAINGVTAAIEKMNARLEARDEPEVRLVNQMGRPAQDPNDLVKYVPFVSDHPFTGDGEGNNSCTHVTGYTQQMNPDDIPRPIPCAFPKESHG